MSGDYLLPDESNVYPNARDITMELPSQTISRNKGQFFSRMLEDEQFFEQTLSDATMRRKSIKKGDLKEKSFNDVEALMDGEFRRMPFPMEFKRNLKNRFYETRRENEERGMISTKPEVEKKLKSATSSVVYIFNNFWSESIRKVEGNFGSGVASYFIFLRSLFFLSIPSFILNFTFISIPQLIDPPPKDPNIHFTGVELLTGANWLNDTIMYYGHYTNGSISTGLFYYKMQYAYILTIFFYFLFCLIWLIKETAVSFRKSYVESILDTRGFASKVFCSWNCNVVSKENADLLHKSIFFDLKEVLAEKKFFSMQNSSGSTSKVVIKRVMVWLMWMLVTAGSLAFIYYLNELFIQRLLTNTILDLMLLSLFVSTVNLLSPYFINFITHLEEYRNPRNEIYVAVFRTFLLKIGMLAVICSFWTVNIQKGDQVECWETQLGQEVYRLVVVDFIFSIFFSTFCMEFLKRLLADRLKSVNRPNFMLAINVLDLIYGQTLCWVGVFFSPIISLIVIIKYILLFYIKKISVVQNCRASKRQWRASQIGTFFNFILLFSLTLTFSFIIYVVVEVKPSATCGPYRGLSTAYEFILSWYFQLSDPTIQWLVTLTSILFNVWFLYAVVVFLLIHLSFVRSKAIGRKKLSERLQDEIDLQGKDKALLLSWLRKMSTNQPAANSIHKKKHRAPVLERHRDSIESRSSLNFCPPELKILSPTHVDPQHVTVSGVNPFTEDLKRLEHIDPIVKRAFANQVSPAPIGETSGVVRPRSSRYFRLNENDDASN